MIAIIDYGMGNLRSVQKAFETVGCPAVVTRSPQVIRDASHVVLPGVGAFADCMKNLDHYGLIQPIRAAIQSGKPFLGICLGFQVLFSESEEFGLHKGLDILSGRVLRFPWTCKPSVDSRPAGSAGLKVPHMGWNQITIERRAPPLAEIENGASLYFVHSYYVAPADPSVIATTTTYGLSFASSIWRDNVVACQFHPEKSQSVGLRIVKNFGAWQ
ncbi:Imidazole glycerol phosphate synthase subunit HisH [Nitrospira tepida]|uniref:Imidazole glycerol phosphate synthase subunit HisH n=1 Tax=Nitrospira tepida TaxID=2973512 RepID=A0AA86T5R0_9BACT|nr:imidazole glycerol phosphate synthase subunit HisH [Nitrospira tepida]CAI4030847.1 Imidazole glycerol phosphate synthase subunit HisH [Nitrospira tepida]